MFLRPVARFFTESIFRTSFFVICCDAKDFVSTFKQVMRTADLSKEGRQKTLNALLASDDGNGGDVSECYGRCYRLTPEVFTNDTAPIVVIYLRPGTHVSTLAHEAVHAATWVLCRRGMQLSCDPAGADEPMAYYVDWIVRSALGGTKSR